MANTTQTGVVPGIRDVKTGLDQPRQKVTLSKSAGRFVGLTLTYILLTIGALIMFFPMLWMLAASLKPSWQILTQPLGFPSEWIHVQAGNTIHEFPVWRVTDSDGQQVEVFTIGSRRYTVVVDASRLTELYSVPAEELSQTTQTEVEGAVLNVRTWIDSEGEQRDVVALARDGSNLVVVPVDVLASAIDQMALVDVNSGSRASLEIEGFSFQAREIEDGRTVIAIGPESQRTVVAPTQVAAHTILVPADAPINPRLVPIGETDLEHYNLAGGAEDAYYIVLSSGPWQPIIDLDLLREASFSVPKSQLSGDPQEIEVNSALMAVEKVTLEDNDEAEVIILLETAQRALVLPVEFADSIRLSPLGKLAEPFVETINNSSVRYRDDFMEDGERHAVAIIGQQRNMSLVAPETAFIDAFDVDPRDLARVQHPRLYIENYIDALSRDLGGATFFTFFRNSALLVVLNLLGHFLSVTIVAYGFARLRAPGKNVLFMILLATMMMPFPVLLIPTYEIFQQFGMINTHWPLFIRAFFGNAFLIFLLRQFFMSIPLELEDAARIDGAHTLQILWHVMLPLSKPALATMGIFTFWWTWNSFFEPYVYLSSIKLFTVSLGLGFFKSQYTYTFHLLMAASVIAILPIITIFFFAQRYFIEGIQLSGLKG